MACESPIPDVPYVECCQLGCVRRRVMFVNRLIMYHFAAGEWYLGVDDPEFCNTGDVNRWSQARICRDPVCQPCQFSDSTHVSNKILQATLFADFEALTNVAWPAPPANANSFEEWRIEPTYGDSGNIIVPNDSPVLPASPCGIITEYHGGDINGFWDDPLTTPWEANWGFTPATVPGIIKSKAQIRHDLTSSERRICLYETRLHPASAEKFNCRELILPPDEWIDIPAPAFNHRTMMDMNCACLPP